MRVLFRRTDDVTNLSVHLHKQMSSPSPSDYRDVSTLFPSALIHGYLIPVFWISRVATGEGKRDALGGRVTCWGLGGVRVPSVRFPPPPLPQGVSVSQLDK